MTDINPTPRYTLDEWAALMRYYINWMGMSAKDVLALMHYAMAHTDSEVTTTDMAEAIRLHTAGLLKYPRVRGDKGTEL